jgi:predicted  nucleic acid-binding Zn-ribbon protein
MVKPKIDTKRKKPAFKKVVPSFDEKIKKITDARNNLSEEIEKLARLVTEKEKTGIEALVTNYLDSGEVSAAFESKVKKISEEQSRLKAKQAVFSAMLRFLTLKEEQLEQENKELRLKLYDEQIKKKKAEVDEARDKSKNLETELEDLKLKRRQLTRI